MKFPSFNIVPGSLYKSIAKVFLSLEQGLRSLSFADNFRCQTCTIQFSGSGEVSVPNPFLINARGEIPSEWLVVGAVGSGSYAIVRGTTDWTAETLYFKNATGGTVAVTLRLFI